MAGTLGTIRGQMVLDVKQALAAYTSARLAHLQTVTALRTGGAALQTAGLGIAAVGVSILAGLKSMADAAAEFERKMDYAGAVTGATQEQLKALSDAAIQIGQDTIYSAGQIADSFVELAKSGVSTQDIIDGIGRAVANLGAAADIPLDTAANIITSAVQTFQLGADQAVHVADLLAGAANASIVDVEDLGTSLKYVGGVANSLGVPIESVNDALALLGTYGIKGSTAGTSLRQILVSLTGSTKAATQKLTDLGIITEDGSNKFFDAEGHAKSLSDIFQILQDATAGLTDEQKVAAYRTIFQNRALAAALDLTKSGAQGFADMNAEISKTTAMDVASKRLDNLSGDIEILRGNLETLAIKNGSQLQAFLRQLVQGLTSAVQWFTNLSPATQAFLIKAAAVTGIVLTLVGLFGVIAGSILNIISLFIRLSDAFKAFNLISKAVTVAQWAMNSAFLANPITLIVLAVIALVAAFIILWNNCEGFRNFWIELGRTLVSAWNATLEWFKALPAWFAGVWNSIRTNTVNTWNNIVTWFSNLFNNIATFFTNVWNNIVNGITNAWNGVLNFFKTLWNNITSFLATWGTVILAVLVPFIGIPLLIAQHWQEIVDFLKTIPGKIVSFFTDLPAKMGYIIGFMIGTVLRLLIEFGTNAWNAITTAWNAIVDFFAALPGRIAAFFTMLWTNITTTLTNIYNDAVAWTITAWENIVAWFEALPGRIATFFSTLWTNVTTWLTQTYNDAVAWTITAWENILAWFQALPGRIGGFFSTLWNNVTSWLSKTATSAGTLASNVFNNVINWLTQLPGRVGQFFTDVYNNIVNKFTDAKNRALEIGTNIYNGIRDAINGLPGLVSGIFDNVISAIKGLVNRAFDAVKDFASGLWNGFKDGLGIHSPSYIEKAMWQITDVVGTETANMKNQVKTLQNIGNGISEYSASVGDNFNTGVQNSIKDLQNQMASAQAYQNQLAQLAATSVFGISTPATNGTVPTSNTPTVVVQAGDQIDLDVTWEAAPDSTVSTRQQAKDLLGKALTTVTDAEVK